MIDYQIDLSRMPRRMLARPRQRGIPVPWFSAKMPEGGYDLRLANKNKIPIAIKQNLCWICGQNMGTRYAFAIGPMCCVNRVTSEPPAHRECALWAIEVCPSLGQRQLVRRETNMPEGREKAAGYMIEDLPGVTCLYVTRDYTPFQLETGILIDMGEPIEVTWWRHSRLATRAEVEEAFAAGYPALEEMAQKEGGDAIAGLEKRLAVARELLPKAPLPPLNEAAMAPEARCGHHDVLLNGKPCPSCFPPSVYLYPEETNL